MNYGLRPTDRAELTVNRKLVNRPPKLPHEGETATYNGITIVFRAGAWRDDRPVAQRLAGLPVCGEPKAHTAESLFEGLPIASGLERVTV